jgi:hydrogenase nickel incorporation protein HypA/HybF
MHEERMLQDIRRKVEEVARDNGATHVRRVALWVGALAHLTEDQARARWSEMTRGTVAQDSALDIEQSKNLDDPRAQSIVLTSIEI